MFVATTEPLEHPFAARQGEESKRDQGAASC